MSGGSPPVSTINYLMSVSIRYLIWLGRFCTKTSYETNLDWCLRHGSSWIIFFGCPVFSGALVVTVQYIWTTLPQNVGMCSFIVWLYHQHKISLNCVFYHCILSYRLRILNLCTDVSSIMHILLLCLITIRIAISVCNLIMVLLLVFISCVCLLSTASSWTPLEYVRLWGSSWLLYSI